jgi:hypothetical protein
MRIKEIMEATPGNGPASATQVKPPAPARPATPATRPAIAYDLDKVQTKGDVTTVTTPRVGGAQVKYTIDKNAPTADVDAMGDDPTSIQTNVQGKFGKPGDQTKVSATYNKDIGAITPDDQPDALKIKRGGFTINKAQGQAPTASYQLGRNKLNTQQIQQAAQGKTPTGLK